VGFTATPRRNREPPTGHSEGKEQFLWCSIRGGKAHRTKPLRKDRGPFLKGDPKKKGFWRFGFYCKKSGERKKKKIQLYKETPTTIVKRREKEKPNKGQSSEKLFPGGERVCAMEGEADVVEEGRDATPKGARRMAGSGRGGFLGKRGVVGLDPGGNKG